MRRSGLKRGWSKKVNSFRVIILTIVGVVSFSILGWADKLPAAFVDIGYGARPLGMANAFVAIADDPNALIWNPAGLTQIKGQQATFMNTKQKGIVPYNFLAFVHPLKSLDGVAGAGVIVSGDDLLKEVTIILGFGQNLAKYSAKLNDLKAGLTLKLRHASFGNNSDGGEDRVTGDAFGLGFDLGFLYKLSKKVTLGANLGDFLAPCWWDSSVSGKYNQSLPFVPVFGAKYEAGKSTIFALDLSSLRELHVGAEKRVHKYINLRAGYNQTIDKRPRTEYALGLGINPVSISVGSLSLDLAYRFEELDNSLRFSVNFIH